MTTPREMLKDRTQLLAVALELRSNRSVLDGLVDCYAVFRFTGGVVPREPWELAAVTSYLQYPFGADIIPTAAAERYRNLARTIMESGEDITIGPRPRTLRCRCDIADRFVRDAAEVRSLGSMLESAMTKLAADLKPSLQFAETESVASAFAMNAILESNRGGDQ